MKLLLLSLLSIYMIPRDTLANNFNLPTEIIRLLNRPGEFKVTQNNQIVKQGHCRIVADNMGSAFIIEVDGNNDNRFPQYRESNPYVVSFFQDEDRYVENGMITYKTDGTGSDDRQCGGHILSSFKELVEINKNELTVISIYSCDIYKRFLIRETCSVSF
ncbi:MAG: hypothetical protein RJB66_241 [Pseudomonadota bacterium]